VIVALGALLGMFGGLMTAGPALARGPQWELVPPDPFTLPADYCGFAIGGSVLVDKEYQKILKAVDGSMILLSTGALTIVSRNLSTGKTVTAKISGPAKTTIFPDGSSIVRKKGLSAYAIPPALAHQSGVPPVGVTAGAQTLSMDAAGNVTSFSLQGHVVMDACAALS
jgi:hypothetical protein